MNAWFVVHTHAHAEPTAATHLRRQGFETYLPSIAKTRRHARKVDTVVAPLFPRYLFVHLDPETCRWRAIHSTVGVSGLVCRGDVPATVPVGVVESIREREGADGLIRLDPASFFTHGQAVRVMSGAFADRVGLFDSRVDEERVIVLLNLLGRQVKTKVPATAVATV